MIYPKEHLTKYIVNDINFTSYHLTPPLVTSNLYDLQRIMLDEFFVTQSLCININKQGRGDGYSHGLAYIITELALTTNKEVKINLVLNTVNSLRFMYSKIYNIITSYKLPIYILQPNSTIIQLFNTSDNKLLLTINVTTVEYFKLGHSIYYDYILFDVHLRTEIEYGKLIEHVDQSYPTLKPGGKIMYNTYVDDDAFSVIIGGLGH